MKQYYLKMLKETGHIDRGNQSDSMIMTVDTQLVPNTILPIAIDRYIVSEAKVIDSNIFQSRIRIILNSRTLGLIPQFEVLEIQNATGDITIQKHANAGTTEEQLKEMEEAIKKSALIDVRPMTPQKLRLLVPDLYDYEGLRNLCMNVRWRT